MRQERWSHQVSMAGMLIGVGMGGFVDGIVLHQIAQWHSMLSNLIPPDTMETMRINMMWDGLFHALTWLVTLVGILRLRSAAVGRAAMPTFQVFAGQLILGWGAFNVIEGIIDHHILGLHNVREVPNAMLYNLTFLAIGGVLFILLGWLLMRLGSRAGAETRR
jgi:uncharacterized membrane protein